MISPKLGRFHVAILVHPVVSGQGSSGMKPSSMKLLFGGLEGCGVGQVQQ